MPRVFHEISVLMQPAATMASVTVVALRCSKTTAYVECTTAQVRLAELPGYRQQLGLPATTISTPTTLSDNWEQMGIRLLSALGHSKPCIGPRPAIKAADIGRVVQAFVDATPVQSTGV